MSYRRWLEHGLARLLPVITLLRRLYWRLLRPITIGVRAVVIDQERVLLVRGHGSQLWHLPGGGVKRGELLNVAAQREVIEETGWTVDVQQLMAIYTGFGDGKSAHVAVFVCLPLRQDRLMLNIEIAEARFFSLTTLPTCYAGVYQALATYRAGQWGSYAAWV